MILTIKDFFRFEVNSELLKVISLNKFVHLCKTKYDVIYHWAGTCCLLEYGPFKSCKYVATKISEERSDPVLFGGRM